MAEPIKQKLNWRMEYSTQVNGLTKSVMDKANKFGLMAVTTRGSGERVKQMDTVHLLTGTVMCMKENGSIVRQTEPALIPAQVEISMLVNGKKMSSMVKALKPGLMVLSTRDSFP